MTCREKLAMEHPEFVSNVFLGGCRGCPDDYGYMDRILYCHQPNLNCYDCWNREIPGSEKYKNGIPWEQIKETINEGMTKRDREFHLYFNPDTGWSVSVYPWPESAANQTEG